MQSRQVHNQRPRSSGGRISSPRLLEQRKSRPSSSRFQVAQLRRNSGSHQSSSGERAGVAKFLTRAHSASRHQFSQKTVGIRGQTMVDLDQKNRSSSGSINFHRNSQKVFVPVKTDGTLLMKSQLQIPDQHRKFHQTTRPQSGSGLSHKQLQEFSSQKRLFAPLNFRTGRSSANQSEGRVTKLQKEALAQQIGVRATPKYTEPADPKQTLLIRLAKRAKQAMNTGIVETPKEETRRLIKLLGPYATQHEKIQRLHQNKQGRLTETEIAEKPGEDDINVENVQSALRATTQDLEDAILPPRLTEFFEKVIEIEPKKYALNNPAFPKVSPRKYRQRINMLQKKLVQIQQSGPEYFLENETIKQQIKQVGRGQKHLKRKRNLLTSPLSAQTADPIDISRETPNTIRYTNDGNIHLDENEQTYEINTGVHLDQSFETSLETIKFTKMHGIGNDYVYVNCFERQISDPQSLAARLSDRRFSVGADGLILVCPPEDSQNHCRMEMYNSDGSRGAMCGNGLRCIAKYVYDYGIVNQDYGEINIETDSGVKKAIVYVGQDGKVDEVAVDMGPPNLQKFQIPLDDGQSSLQMAINLPLEIDECIFSVTGVSMGNPHAVVNIAEIQNHSEQEISKNLENFDVEKWGKKFENHAWFPQRVNTEFISIRSRDEMDFRVWERGSGETYACGTGACAAVVAGVLNGWCDREVLVCLKGGNLKIRWEGTNHTGTVWMLGPVAEVFSGELQHQVLIPKASFEPSIKVGCGSPNDEINIEKLRYEHSPPASKFNKKKLSLSRQTGRITELDWENSLRNGKPLDIRLGNRKNSLKQTSPIHQCDLAIAEKAKVTVCSHISERIERLNAIQIRLEKQVAKEKLIEKSIRQVNELKKRLDGNVEMEVKFIKAQVAISKAYKRRQFRRATTQQQIRYKEEQKCSTVTLGKRLDIMKQVVENLQFEKIFRPKEKYILMIQRWYRGCRDHPPSQRISTAIKKTKFIFCLFRIMWENRPLNHSFKKLKRFYRSDKDRRLIEKQKEKKIKWLEKREDARQKAAAVKINFVAGLFNRFFNDYLSKFNIKDFANMHKKFGSPNIAKQSSPDNKSTLPLTMAKAQTAMPKSSSPVEQIVNILQKKGTIVSRPNNLSPSSMSDSGDSDNSLDQTAIKRLLTKTRPPPDKKRKPLGGFLPVKQKTKKKITVQTIVDGKLVEKTIFPLERPHGQTIKYAQYLHDKQLKANSDLSPRTELSQFARPFTPDRAIDEARHMKKAQKTIFLEFMKNIKNVRISKNEKDRDSMRKANQLAFTQREKNKLRNRKNYEARERLRQEVDMFYCEMMVFDGVKQPPESPVEKTPARRKY